MNSYLVGFIVALLTGVALLATQRWHGHLSLDSTIGPQKFHTHPTLRVGGIAIVAGMLASLDFTDPDSHRLLWPLIFAGAPAFIFGLAEDLTKRVSVRARLLATMACGVLGWAITGQSITDVNVPGLDWLLDFTVLSVAFTAFAVGGVANAINIIDGFNGLASGAVIIILCSFMVMANAFDDADLIHISLNLVAPVLGFGVLNWPRGRLFLGDGGAYFLGFALAWLAVLLLARHSEISAWAPMLACGYPILEVLFSMLRRRRRRNKLGDPDCLHLHSLVKRRLVRQLLPHASHLMRNSVTGAIMWGAALLPAVIAARWPTDTPALVLAFFICALLYSAAYARLTQFRWCVSALTLRPANASNR